MRLRRLAISAFRGVGGLRIVERWFGRDRLTVLAYHRVVDHTASGFIGFAQNASASPEAFADQMRVVAAEYNPVSIDDVADAVDGQPLPDRALLVTFDDGYRDNHDLALPSLTEYSIPAVVFLATDHIGSGDPFWWDRVAWMFETTGPGAEKLPVLGEASWESTRKMAARWIAAAKLLTEAEKAVAIDHLAAVLDAPEIGSTFAASHLEWDMVRSMQNRNIAFGAHTCSHPILSRVDLDTARVEVVRSVERVAKETGQMPIAFAYPNGLPGDYPDAVVEVVGDTGITLGFTLSPGPARKREFSGDPLRIPRVFVHHTDDLVSLGAKMAGIPRFLR